MNPLANYSTSGDSESETSDAKSSVSADIDDAFRWTVRPSDKEPSKKWVVLAVALCALGLGLFVFKSLLFGVLGMAIILGSTAEYWLGVSYKIDPKSASARCGLSLTSLEWAEVKRASAGDDGIKLSPLEGSGRMDAFRGVFLRYGADPETVKQAVRRWLPAHVELMG